MAGKVGITKMWVSFQRKWQSHSPWNAEGIGNVSGAWCPGIAHYLSWISPICPDIRGQIKRKDKQTKPPPPNKTPQNTWLKKQKISPKLCVTSTVGLPWWLPEPHVLKCISSGDFSLFGADASNTTTLLSTATKDCYPHLGGCSFFSWRFWLLPCLSSLCECGSDLVLQLQFNLSECYCDSFDHSCAGF